VPAGFGDIVGALHAAWHGNPAHLDQLIRGVSQAGTGAIRSLSRSRRARIYSVAPVVGEGAMLIYLVHRYLATI